MWRGSRSPARPGSFFLYFPLREIASARADLTDGEHAGVDVVERALGGYGILEHWRGAGGGLVLKLQTAPRQSSP